MGKLYKSKYYILRIRLLKYVIKSWIAVSDLMIWSRLKNDKILKIRKILDILQKNTNKIMTLSMDSEPIFCIE